MTSAETIVEGSGVETVPESGGTSDDGGGLIPWPAGGLVTLGGAVTGGQVEPIALAGTGEPGPASCQADTAGGAAGMATRSAAGGLTSGVGARKPAVDGMTGTVVTVVDVTLGKGAVEGVSGGTGGTRLVGFRTSAAATRGVVDVVPVPVVPT